MLGPGTEVGRYVIKRKLAEGGMAEIFLASAVGPEGFSKDVVIKVVKAFLAKDSQFVQMFIEEARLVSKLNHANVVQIFDFGKHGDSFYLAMEYVRGASLWDLRKRCRDRGVPFPPTLTAEIGAQVARGLQYAHALTQVHRDVTPHNVLLSFDGAVKLTDFGIAKATTQQTAPGMLKGKFAYMAPEQARGEKVDARTDLFALGIVLWELLTGGRLFTGDSDLALLRAVQESLIAPPSRLNPDVPQELSDVVMKALARPVEERFQSGFEMEKALANFVLRNAKSVDDSSVAMFLQHLFKEEFEAPSDHVPEDGDDFGEGKTAQRDKPKTITATPVPTTPGRRGIMDDDDDGPSVRTEEFTPHARPRTEQMPAMKRPSRKLEPLPVQEPSVVVRPSVGLPDITSGVSATEKASSPGETEPALAPAGDLPALERSKAPIMGALAVAAIGLVGLLGYIVTRPNEAPPMEIVEVEKPDAGEVAEKTDPAKKDDSVVTTPVEAPDAGPTIVAVQTPPEKQPEDPPPTTPKKTEPPVRKFGSIAITARPFAMVTVPGKQPVEVTGMKSIQAPVGTYEISISHPRKKLKQKVTVTANQTTSVTFSAD